MSEHSTAAAAAPDATHGLGRVGVWTMELRFGDPGLAREAAVQIEEMGYGAAWIPGGIGGDVLGDIDPLMSATTSLSFATGILNIYRQDAPYVLDWWNASDAARRERMMFGIGASHRALVGDDYRKPLQAISEYLDELDAGGVPAARRCLAAQRPKMLALAAERSAGAHPFIVTPEHSAKAREIMGPAALLAPEQGVVLETDPEAARGLIRAVLGQYTALPNYTRNWLELGFTQDDIEHMSDRLVDAFYAWGTPEQVSARIQEHLDAGADHVAVQVLHAGAATMTPPFEEWRILSEVLTF